MNLIRLEYTEYKRYACDIGTNNLSTLHPHYMDSIYYMCIVIFHYIQLSRDLYLYFFLYLYVFQSSSRRWCLSHQDIHTPHPWDVQPYLYLTPPHSTCYSQGLLTLPQKTFPTAVPACMLEYNMSPIFMILLRV